VRTVLAAADLRSAAALVALSTLIASIAALRIAETLPFDEFVYGERRSGLITALLDLLGRERTAVVVYLLQRSWSALIAATALTPIFIWLLGSTAVHAAARLGGSRARFAPLLAFFGHATALVRVPADLAAIVAPPAAGLVSGASTLWLGYLTWHAIRSHYALAPQRALTTLALAIGLFYLAPLALIVVAVIAIVAAAIMLDYVPPL
jgi:hypothetical protein